MPPKGSGAAPNDIIVKDVLRYQNSTFVPHVGPLSPPPNSATAPTVTVTLPQGSNLSSVATQCGESISHCWEAAFLAHRAGWLGQADVDAITPRALHLVGAMALLRHITLGWQSGAFGWQPHGTPSDNVPLEMFAQCEPAILCGLRALCVEGQGQVWDRPGRLHTLSASVGCLLADVTNREQERDPLVLRLHATIMGMVVGQSAAVGRVLGVIWPSVKIHLGS